MEIKVAKRPAKFTFFFLFGGIVIVITIFRVRIVCCRVDTVLYGNFFDAATSSGSRWRIRNKLRPRHVACQKKLCTSRRSEFLLIVKGSRVAFCKGNNQLDRYISGRGTA